MTERFPDLNKKVDDWLTSLDFSMGNPFASVEAERERDKLSRFFIDVPGIAEIKGGGSIIIFAPQGGGKSALRVMLANETAPHDTSKSVFSVEFTDFDSLIKHAHQGTLNSETGVSMLLKVGIEALLSFLLKEPNWPVPEAAKIEMSQFLNEYTSFLLTPQAMLQRLAQLTPTVSLTQMGVTWGEFRQLVEDGEFSQLSARLVSRADVQMLAELNDFAVGGTAVPSGPVRQMKAFYALCNKLRFSGVYFLIDRVDEFPETAKNPALQADLLAPFLGHLPLLEMEGVAFKFFLPEMVRGKLETRGWLRVDRIRMKTTYLDWDETRLIRLLNERMRVFSQQKVSDLGQICESKVVAEEIEQWTSTAVSPRQLLIAMQKLCDAHVMQAGPVGFLTMADLEAVKGELHSNLEPSVSESSKIEKLEVFPTLDGVPLLRINIQRHMAWIGKDQIKFTPNQFKILKALIENDGRCSYNDLAFKVWPDEVIDLDKGIQDDRMSRNISRLRDKLGESGESQNYLKTVRGWGFELKKFVRLDS